MKMPSFMLASVWLNLDIEAYISASNVIKFLLVDVCHNIGGVHSGAREILTWNLCTKNLFDIGNSLF